MELAQDASGHWVWMLWAGNGQPLCQSSRAYLTRKHAIQAVEAMPRNWSCVRVVARVVS